jgi:predicted nucleic acid-binding protein
LKQSYILDTNVLLALIRGNALGIAIDSAYGLRASLQRHIISIASQAEISVLADKHQWGNHKREALSVMFERIRQTNACWQLQIAGGPCGGRELWKSLDG